MDETEARALLGARLGKMAGTATQSQNLVVELLAAAAVRLAQRA
ncbi:hypothetical protein [Amycolatopsis sp. NPDC004079]